MIVPYPFRYGATPLEKCKAIVPERNACSLYPSKDFSDAFYTGNGVQRLDVLIGQTAIALSVPLYTFNQRQYQFIPDLQTNQPYDKTS